MIRANTMADALLTREQAAELLNLNPHTLACWRSEGKGPPIVKFGAGRSSAVRYRRADIEQWLADPVAAEAASREPWREARRRALAAKASTVAKPAPARRAKRRRTSKA
jgi:hypothetical protein